MNSSEDLESIVIDTIAVGCGSRNVAINRDTELLDIGVDSLGLIAMAAHIQSKCQVNMGPLELVDLVHARAVRDVISVITRAIDSAVKL